MRLVAAAPNFDPPEQLQARLSGLRVAYMRGSRQLFKHRTMEDLQPLQAGWREDSEGEEEWQ